MKYHNEPNIMGNYHAPNTPAFDIVSRIRELYIDSFEKGFNLSFLDKLKKGINQKLIDEAKSQAIETKLWLDEPTFQFFQGYNKHIINNEKRDLVLLVNGVYIDNHEKKLSTTIPFILGENPYQVYRQMNPNIPLDTAITDFKTLEYLSNHMPELRKHHYKTFIIKSSSFFFIPKKLNEYFDHDHGHVNFEKLVPFLDGRANNVTIRQTDTPSLDLYLNNQFNFSSKRFKLSPVTKIMRKLNDQNILGKKDLVCDWSALRVVRNNLDELIFLQSELLEYKQINLGSNKFKVKEVLLKNYFLDPKDTSGFKAYVNHLFFENKGETYPIEIQFQTTENYYNYEILNSPSNPASRINKEKRREISEDDNHHKFNELVRNILTQIYGQPQTTIDLKKLTIQRR